MLENDRPEASVAIATGFGPIGMTSAANMATCGLFCFSAVDLLSRKDKVKRVQRWAVKPMMLSTLETSSMGSRRQIEFSSRSPFE